VSRTVLACRLDNIGDVVLTGPAVRAIARQARVIMLASPSGAQVARLLPGVSEVMEFDAPWVGYQPRSVDADSISRIVEELRRHHVDEAVIFTSYHQSSLPLAFLLRLAGVGRITAISEDFPGSLLDVRCSYRPELHEVEQNAEIAAAAGFPVASSDDLLLRVDVPLASEHVDDLPERYVVVHPGASVAARALPRELARAVCGALASDGRQILVTGSRHEAVDVDRIIDGLGPSVRSMAGSLTLEGLCRIIARADAVVCGNTGPAHLAAALGTPVVEVFAPVVDPQRWRPWGVTHRLLGDATVPCAGCRARTCPRTEQICVDRITASDVLAALDELVPQNRGVPA
jgi:ADP-heptose:LPS heptosyltransferase